MWVPFCLYDQNNVVEHMVVITLGVCISKVVDLAGEGFATKGLPCLEYLTDPV